MVVAATVVCADILDMYPLIFYLILCEIQTYVVQVEPCQLKVLPLIKDCLLQEIHSV